MEGDTFVCAIAGALAGQRTVLGDDYIATFGYYYSHVWRNFGILCAFLVFFMALYFVATEINSSTTSTAEALVFRRGHVPAYLNGGSVKGAANDVEMTAPPGSTKESTQSDEVNMIPPQKDIFTWKEVVYDIEINGEPRRLLDHVSGWVKPGTLTALMGVSGAGKTTLLDALAQRTSIGVITGEMFVNGRSLDSGFQRKTGYVQQQGMYFLGFASILSLPLLRTRTVYDP
jgi:ABC-type multidrug transport system fused ATPase/permease subunit